MNIRLVAADSSRKANSTHAPLEIGLGYHIVNTLTKRLTMKFEPTRAAGLEKLSNFVPKAARDYSSGRNYDLPDQGHPHVSSMSPYLRHRLISEQEVIQAVLGRYSQSSAEKFVQEVYWRTYWKGWLEQRPQVWYDYITVVKRLEKENSCGKNYELACRGETGLSYFNSWVHELVTTGYMHNHARMWFASIWVFSLQLPWQLGADFFLRHLIDGDPASNTLSWRWVAGLQTVGKTYLARPSNVEKYTQGKFLPRQEDLPTIAAPLEGPPHPSPRLIPSSTKIPEDARIGFLMTEEDMNPSFLLRQKLIPVAFGVFNATNFRSPFVTSKVVTRFVDGALRDSASRFSNNFGTPDMINSTDLHNWVAANDVTDIVTSYVPTGPTLDALNQSCGDHVNVHQVKREYDQNAWPFASAGFFKFKKNIPDLISRFK